MRKVDQQLQGLLHKLPTQLGYTDSLHQQIVQILFQFYYFDRKPKSWLLIPYTSVQIIKQDQLMTIYTNLKGLATEAPIHDLLHHKSVSTLDDPRIERFIQINNKLYQGSASKIVSILCSSLGSKKTIQQRISKIERTDQDTYFIINNPYYHHIRKAQPKDLHWIRQGYNRFLLDTDIGKINWLLSTPVSSYKLHQLGSINKSTIVKLRDHDRQVQNLTLINSIKFKRLADYLHSDSNTTDAIYLKKHPNYLQRDHFKTRDSLIKKNYQINYGFNL